jgi:hypothetical protein
MQIHIQIQGLDAMRQQLGTLAKQANYATSRAINTAAFAVNTRLKTGMASTFVGGATAYTLRAFRVEQARRDNLTATIALRTDTAGASLPYNKALAHLFTGGLRKYKKIEGWLRARRLLPNGYTIAPGAGMPLDRFGNMRQAALTEMLGVLGTQRTNLRVYRHTGRGKAQKAVGYFVATSGDKSGHHPGIYKRIETGSSSAISPMVLYVRPTTYRRFIDLERVGNEVVATTFQSAFDAELAKALASAR